MPNLLDGVHSDDAAFGFVNADEFAEAVTFTPRSTGTGRSVYVVVTRHPPIDRGNGLRPFMEIEAHNHATLGVVPGSLDFGGDTITVSYDGGTAQAFLIHKPQEPGLWFDAGTVRLELW